MPKSVNDRINGPAIDAFQQLDGGLQFAIGEYLTENPTKELYSKDDIVRAWLEWNGIIGFTSDIIHLVQQTFKE